MSNFDPGHEYTTHTYDTLTFGNVAFKDWPEQLDPVTHGPQLHLAASDGERITPPTTQYRLGETNLPVARCRDEFLSLVNDNQSIVVGAETGAGKSSQLGLYLLEAGVPMVYVTQPRILAARELMQRARTNLGPDHERLAGYLTGNAEDSDCPSEARLVYVTEDILFEKVLKGELPPNTVVINDEAHEKGPGTIFLLAALKRQQQTDPGAGLKVIVSSATIKEEDFSKYLDDAPILKIPGRTFPVERLVSHETPAHVSRHYMMRPNEKNVLTFEPGKAPLKSTWAKMQSRLHDHTVHTLHGDQSPRQQTAALVPEDKHHIVATDVAATSITPENKDVVVDSTLANLGGYVQGKRVLTTGPASKARILQRGGRVGRTKPGIHVLAQPDNCPPLDPFELRPDFDPPAIENSSIASYLLKLYARGLTLEDLDLLESPTAENYRYDVTLLKRLGAVALDSQDVAPEVTAVGHAMTRIGLDSGEARMLIEARRYAADEGGAVDNAIRLQVAAAVAVQQVKGILDTQTGTKRNYLRNRTHQAALSSEQSSDFIFELDVFTEIYHRELALLASGAADQAEKFERILLKHDILPNRYYKAARIYRELCRREELEPVELHKPTPVQRRQIVLCQLTGIHEAFVQRGKQTYLDRRGERRTIGTKSTINPMLGSIVVGTAFDRVGLNKRGRYLRRFISGGSIATPEQFLAAVPERVTTQSHGYGVNRQGKLVERRALYLDNELKIADIEGPLPPTLETRAVLVKTLMLGEAPDLRRPSQNIALPARTPNASAAQKKWRHAQSIEERSSVNLNIRKRYSSLINQVIRQSVDTLPLDITSIEQIDALVPKVFVASLVRPSRRRRTYPAIVTSSPDGISIHTDEDETDYIDVNYKSKIAYVTVPRDYKFTIRREDFAKLAKHHEIKLRIANGKYGHIGDVFAKIDEDRSANEKRRISREARVAQMNAGRVRSTEKKETQERRRQERQKSIQAKIAEKVLAKPPTSLRDIKKRYRYAGRLGLNTPEL